VPLWLGDDVDAQLTDLIFWGLAKDRAERPRSMRELGKALAQWLLDRGVEEDVCGGSLINKWLTQSSMQRSIPLIQLGSDPPPRPTPPPATPNGTLISARGVTKVVAAREATPTLSPTGAFHWAWLVVAAALVAGAAWRLSRPSAPLTSAPVAAPSPASAATEPRPLTPAAPATTPSLAATPPSPSTEITRAVAAPHHSAPLVALPAPRSPKSRPAPSSTEKPKQVGHDETRELLQAY
jgi:hypothetical protein